jgi:hypothetical protein
MADYTYQICSFEGGDHILVFKDELFERKIYVSKAEIRSNPYVWVVDDRFRTLFQGNAILAYRWLETDPDKEYAKQVGIGKDFQMLSVGEFKELYG